MSLFIYKVRVFLYIVILLVDFPKWEYGIMELLELLEFLFGTEHADYEGEGTDCGFVEGEGCVVGIVGMTDDVLVVVRLDALDHRAFFGVYDVNFAPLDVTLLAHATTSEYVATEYLGLHGVAMGADEIFCP